MDDLTIKKEQVVSLLETKFIKVYDLQYEEGRHYFDATRREQSNLVATKTIEEFKKEIPDAVSCVVVADVEGEEPRLCVMKEYRYPVGRYVLSIPSGLIDTADKDAKNPSFEAAIREIKEEIGVSFDESKDEIIEVNPLLFCSPGMTDECTSLVKVVIHTDKLPKTNHDGAVGSELFGKITWITKKEAKKLLQKGRDSEDIFYPAITWIAMMTFVSDLW